MPSETLCPPHGCPGAPQPLTPPGRRGSSVTPPQPLHPSGGLGGKSHRTRRQKRGDIGTWGVLIFLGGGERERCVGQRSLCKTKSIRELNASEEAGRKKVISRRIPAPPDLPVLLCLPEVGCGSSWIPGSGPIPPLPSGSWEGSHLNFASQGVFFFLQSRGLFGHYFIIFYTPE